MSQSSLSSVGELFYFYSLVCVWNCSLMSGKKKRAASPSGSKLQPTVLHDTLGAYITGLSGNLYLSKLDESNKSQSKCVVVSGKWYSPPEFETLAGKKARKWRQSLHHLEKPLSLYLFPSYSGLFSGWSAGLVSWFTRC